MYLLDFALNIHITHKIVCYSSRILYIDVNEIQKYRLLLQSKLLLETTTALIFLVMG